jgi:uncharacterized protein with FMN-binding domain
MKKIFIGLAILFVFGIYSLGIRHQKPVIVKPASLASTTSSGTGSSTASSSTKTYKDGTYTGSIANAYYGNVQVKVTISGGKMTNVQFLQYPDTHQTSVVINQQAMPYLQREAIQTQSSNVQIVSGATFTSQAFQQSLQAALVQAV